MSNAAFYTEDQVVDSVRAERRGRRARGRALIYSYFAQALAPPNSGLFEEAADGSLLRVLEAGLAALPLAHRELCSQPVASVCRALADEAAGSDAALDVEYARLFGNGVVCPHYEAAYVSSDPFRDVHVVAKIAGLYQAHGVQVASAIGERPDYVAVELEFMNFLCTKQARASQRAELQRVGQCRQMQRDFFTQHLGCWIRPFCDKLVEVTRLPFYEALSRALICFIDAETHYLGVGEKVNHR